MKKIIQITLAIILMIVFLIPDTQSLGQYDPSAVTLFEEILKIFNLPPSNNPDEKFEETQTYRVSSRRFTEYNRVEQPIMYLNYEQNHEKGIRGGGAYCKSRLVIKTRQISKLPDADREKVASEARNGFIETTNELLTQNPGLKQNQQTIGNTTFLIFSGSGTIPGGSKDHSGFDISLEKDIIYWTRGDWVFSVDREISIETGGGGACGAEFKPVPSAMEWAETVYRISEQIGMIEGTEQSAVAQDWVYPNTADCIVGIHPNYPLVLSIKLGYPNKPGRPQTDTVRLEWEGNSNFPLEYQLFQDTPNSNPGFEKKDWREVKNNAEWITSNGQIKIPLRFILNRIPNPITPKTPYSGRVNIYGTASLEDKAYSKKLGSCQINLDFVAIAQKIKTYGKTTANGEGKVERYSNQYLPPWEKLSGTTRLYQNEVIRIEKATSLEILYIDGTRVQIATEFNQKPFTMTITTNPRGNDHPLLNYILTEYVENKVEGGIKFIITKALPKAAGYLNPAVGFIFLADDVYDVGNYLYQDFTATSLNSVARIEKAEDNTKFFQFSSEPVQEMDLSRIKSAAVYIKSFVEVTNNQGAWVIRTIEGNPDVYTADGKMNSLEAGQVLVTNPDATLSTIVEFDPQSIEKWWDAAIENQADEIYDNEFIPLENLTLKELPTENQSSGENRAKFNIPLLWMVVPGVLCFGAAALVLLVGILKKNRKISLAGFVLIVTVFCVGIGVSAYFGFSNWIEHNDDSQLPDTSPNNSVTSDHENLSAVESLNPNEQEEQAASEQKEPASTLSQLSQAGPWVIIPSNDGIWGMNPDGSGLTRLFHGKLAAPYDFNTAIAPGGTKLAFVTADTIDTLQGLQLMLLSLPDGKVETITPLTSPAMEPPAKIEICDPRFEAARAVTIGNGLAWSADGENLAFIGAMQGSSADLYNYSLNNGQILRLSDEPAQAYDIHFSQDNSQILFFSASCFGTGAGFNNDSVWAVNLNDQTMKEVYRPDSESYGEKFVGWAKNLNNAFMVATISGCPYRDLRLIEIDSSLEEMIFDGCFNDFALGPYSSLAVLAGEDFTESPGIYLFPEPDISTTYDYFPYENGRQLKPIQDTNLILIQTFEQTGIMVKSLDIEGNPGWYQGQGSFPIISKNQKSWGWEENDVFFINIAGESQPRILSNNPIQFPFWFEDDSSNFVEQKLIFFGGLDGRSLYLSSSPDFNPLKLADGIEPFSSPILIQP